MKVSLVLAVVAAVFSLNVEFPQLSFAQTVAYVYVASSPSAKNYQLNAYSADSKGTLTPISGSPFATTASTLAANSHYLFGADDTDIYTYSIGSDGSLTQVSSIDAAQYNGPPGGDGGPYFLFLDRTGSTLYDVDIYGDEAANNTFQFFDINQGSGVLSYLGASNGSIQYWTPMRFIGNNQFAYGAEWVHLDSDIYGYQRSSSGALTDLNLNPSIPAAKAGSFYVSYLTATGPNNNLAISLTPASAESLQIDGPPQLAVYTADRSGNLTTHSTRTNMPKTAVEYVEDMEMSPTGDLLAVGGMKGVQLFHFNGSKPITRFTGLILKSAISTTDQMFWDKNHHLYVISNSTGELYVFTITAKNVRQAPGSPYAITNPLNISVLPMD